MKTYFSQRNIQIAFVFLFLLFIYCNYDGTGVVEQSKIIVEFNTELRPHVQKVERLMADYDQMTSGEDYKTIAYLKRIIPQVREEIDALKAVKLKADELLRIRQQMIDSLEAAGKFLSLAGQLVTKKRGVNQAEVSRSRNSAKQKMQNFTFSRDKLLKKYDLTTQKP